ncbi:hypothetical protein [Candidatus Magnetominusculus dajiuhuensis]|uniref:hypothetical protein n=1 Tax=Candidatus Magnetominusculus dajiuhuensis TaxID=3137712 RepID=UPI003B42B6CD
MDNGYYVDVVTKNILSALSEHISDSIADQLIGVVKKTTTQLETRLFTMFDSVSKDIANAVNDNMRASNERLLAIEESLNEIRQRLGAVNTAQIDALAKSVEGGLASIVAELKASLGENNKAQFDALTTTQAEILRMMLEGELRNAEAMAERVNGNKKEIGERLKRLDAFIASTGK